MNVEQARTNMVEQQIRPWEVLDATVLNLFGAVPRERFVPEGFRDLAFSDTGIGLGHGQTMMTPKVEARMLQALDVRATDKVLEIGTGSGYVTALLASLAREVLSIDIHGDFTEAARAKLMKLGHKNVTLRQGDAVDGWPAGAPYDVIAVTGSSPQRRTSIEVQLSIGGRMFIVVGLAPAMEARLITRTGEHDWTCEFLFSIDLPPLVGAEAKAEFVF